MKKLWLMLLAGVLALGLAACGDDGQKQTEQVWLQTKQVTYNADGEPIFTLEREYDEAGRMVAMREAYEGEYDNRSEYTYDTAGRLVRTEEYEGDWLWLVTDTTYTAAGDELEYKEYCAVDDGSELALEEWWQYEYDEAGRQVRWLKCNGDGEAYHTEEYTYDTDGYKLRAVEYENGELWHTEEWERDEAGREVAYAAYWADGELDWSRAYVWDESGNKLEEKQWIGDWLCQNIKYTYDEAGRVLLEEYYDGMDAANNGRRVEYEYDEAGRQISLRDYYGEDGGEQSAWQLDTYDDEGRLVNRVLGQYHEGYDEAPYEYATGYVYEDAGNVVRRSNFDQWQKLSLYAEFEYTQMELTSEQADRVRKEQKEWWDGI